MALIKLLSGLVVGKVSRVVSASSFADLGNDIVVVQLVVVLSVYLNSVALNDCLNAGLVHTDLCSLQSTNFFSNP